MLPDSQAGAQATTDIADPYLSPREVAEDLAAEYGLKTDDDTVRRWVAEGKLPAIRVGGRIRIRRSHIGRIVTAA